MNTTIGGDASEQRGAEQSTDDTAAADPAEADLANPAAADPVDPGSVDPGSADAGSADPESVDPLELARSWLPSNDDPVRPQITLATNGRDGFPAARTVLLSECTPHGFAFHTDAHSSKAADVEADPRVCLVVVWPNFSRQLVVYGTAVRQSDDAIAAAYTRRSPYLRTLAWLNDADFARLPLDERRSRWAAAVAEHPEGPASAAQAWTGFEVRPSRLVFWESATDTASRRTDYRLVGAGWQVDLLPG